MLGSRGLNDSNKVSDAFLGPLLVFVMDFGGAPGASISMSRMGDDARSMVGSSFFDSHVGVQLTGRVKDMCVVFALRGHCESM